MSRIWNFFQVKIFKIVFSINEGLDPRDRDSEKSFIHIIIRIQLNPSQEQRLSQSKGNNSSRIWIFNFDFLAPEPQ